MVPYQALVGKPTGLSPTDKGFVSAEGQRQAAADESGERQVKALVDIADQHQKATDAFAEAAGKASEKFDRDRQAEEETRKAIDVSAKLKMAAVERQLAQLDAAGVDPHRYWSNMSTPSKILAGIFVGLGEFGKNGNTAVKIIDSAVQNDLAAQRANLEKSLAVMGKRGELNKSETERQTAMLNAQRDSTITAYQLAINSIQKIAGQHKDNAQVQAQLLSQINGVMQARDASLGQYHHELYTIGKASEKSTGPGIDVKKWEERTNERIKEQAEAGHEPDYGKAQNDALYGMTGLKLRPDVPQGEYVKPGKISPRISARIAEAQEKVDGLRQLDKLAKDYVAGPGGRAAFTTLRDTLEHRGVKGLPSAGVLGTGGLGSRAAIAAAIKLAESEKNDLEERAKNTAAVEGEH